MTYYDRFKRRWFYSLYENKERQTKGLFDYHSRSHIINTDKFLVQLIPRPKEYLHTIFDTFIDFYVYQREITPENRCFFETIFGEVPQKLYFDIDIDLKEHPDADGEAIKNDLIVSLLKLLVEFNIEFHVQRDILVCTSHGPFKRSYHVILDNFSLPNTDHSKAIYKLVLHKMKPEYKTFIDPSMYKSLQQFRILGSQKKNSGRVKVFQENWMLENICIEYEYPEGILGAEQHVKNSYLLGRTLIGNVKYCKELPTVRINEYALKINHLLKKERAHDAPKVLLNQELIDKVLYKFSEFAGMPWNHPRFPYKYSKSEFNMIFLKRIHASMCRVCQVIHENENPFLKVYLNGNIHFDCRCSLRHGDGTHKTLFIGNIELPNNSLGGMEVPQDRLVESDDDETFDPELVLNLNNLNSPLKVLEISEETKVPDVIKQSIQVSPGFPKMAFNMNSYYKDHHEDTIQKKAADVLSKLNKGKMKK